MRSPAAKLALGTVQFGIAYGVTNEHGQVPAADVARLVEIAVAGGITLLDTAAAYGESETVLGAVAGDQSMLRIVSKIPPVAAAAIGSAE
ncbi:MAG: aldo/keto reductase, partial [Dongiaceae bacterium]